MNRIAEIRKAHGLTQVQLADTLGIAQNTLSQYETERRNPDIKTVTDLAARFHVSVNYVLGLPEQENLPSASVNITDVTKVMESSDIRQINIYLSLGWRLLHVGQSNKYSQADSGVVYSLGWFGDPHDPAAQIKVEDDYWRDVE